MKRFLLFIFPFLIIVAAVLTVFGIMHVRFEEEKLMDDLKRKARSVAESLELSVKNALPNNDLKSINRVAESFQKRERLQGAAIYDVSGKLLAITSRISDWSERDKPYIQEVLISKAPRGALEDFNGYFVYSYTQPVLDDENNTLGIVEVIYDTSYFFTILAQLWKRISFSLIILVSLLALIATLIEWRIHVVPVKRLTDWFKRFQRGEIETPPPIKDKGELGKLASEVEQLALGIRVAKRTISEDAQFRMKKEEAWTEAKLRNLVTAKLGENALYVVSNREPYMHVIDEMTGFSRCVSPPSGVVTAIDPILRACGGTWIAHGSGNADKKFVNSKDKLGVPPKDNRYILKRVWLSKEEEEGYYFGFANEGLWPLCHMTHTRPIFRETDWQMYKKVNQKFADSILEELPVKNPFLFIQDYHFTLLAKMIKEKRPDATIAMFWHIPWPNSEVFATCPYQEAILEGMLACDLIGFHVQNHCNNFLDTANRLLESKVDTEKFSVVRFGKETLIRAFPISIDGYFDRPASSKEKDEIEKIRKEFDLEGKIIALGVDRIDYTKGIVERILAIDRFLEKYPEYKNKFVFIQLAAPSRTHIKRYHDLMAEIDELVDRKNWKHNEADWKPIIYLKKQFSSEEIKPYYALADICIVSSLHDGMNLVAKEYIGSKRDSNGVLILSKFTGAARELTDALSINPYSIEEFADTIKLAVDMPSEEKVKRMENMRKTVSENNVYRWAGAIITELTSLKKA